LIIGKNLAFDKTKYISILKMLYPTVLMGDFSVEVIESISQNTEEDIVSFRVCYSN
jgi:hypothetical protein